MSMIWSTADENKIENVVEKVVPVLQHEYCSTVFEDIHSALVDNIIPASLKEVFSQITEFDRDVDKVKALIFLDQYEKLREDLFHKLLSTYPVIRNKIMQLYKIRKDAHLFADRVNKYGRRVTWHLYRLYRVRNAIVHSGETHRHIQVLGEHLHIYVDAVLSDILFKLACEKTLRSTNDVLTDVRFSLHRKLEICGKGCRIDEQVIRNWRESLFYYEKSENNSNCSE